MWQVIDDTQFCMMVTDYFSKAVAYARQNGWTVYSVVHRVIVYDGMLDVVYLGEVAK